jgi:SAM-dependent methyltransferase
MLIMNDREDAFGRALLDHLHSREGQEIIEREDGFIEADSVGKYFDPPPRWSGYERRSMRYVRGRVLDVGCGAGRVALHLQGRGHPVTAIDVSPLAVRVCTERGVKDARVLPVGRVGPALGGLDTIVMMGNNFGLLGDPEKGRTLLRRLHRITSPEGRIIATSNDVHQTSDPVHLAYQRLNRRRGRMPGLICMRIRYRDRCTPWFDYLMVSSQEMRTILRGTGWEVARILSDDGPMYAAIIEKIRERQQSTRSLGGGS